MSASLCCRRFPLIIKKTILLQPNRNGYIVLLPELNPNIPENFALMKDNMPDFTNLTTERCVTAMGKDLLDFEQGIRYLEESVQKAGSTNVVREILEPIEKISAPFDTTWGIIKNLYLTKTQMMSTGTYLPLHHRARRARNAKFYSKAIYNTLKECDQKQLSEEEQRIVDKYLLEGRLSGLELEEIKRKHLAEIHLQMADCHFKFNKRIEISSNAFQSIIHDPNITREMPDQLLRLMAENKDDPSRGPWKVTLQPQVQELFLAYCPDRNMRWNVWQASSRVASMFLDNSELHNSVTLEKIRQFRRDEANLLGFETFAHMSMETKMAGTVENVQHTLGVMLQIAKPAADRELANLQQFAWERGFEGILEAWDVSFWERKQKRTLFNYQEETLNDFFPLDKVWTGLLAMCERLFDIKFVEDTKVDRWHPDVRFFYIYEESRKPVAGFYLDPYAREDKLKTGSLAGLVVNITPAASKHKTLPLSTLVLSLDPPIYGKPSLLSWADVELLFKQFGHTLQQLLTTVNYSEVAGQSNIEWDAVGIVGNVFRHWLKDPQVLESISGHYATGEKLPVLPLTEMEKHCAGHRLCEELFKAHLDMELYTTKDFWQEIMKRLWPAHFILPHDKWNSLPCNFRDIVTEQWPAAYFSHLWAAMVAADVHSAFTEPDADVKSIGTRFRDTYLSFGGSCHPSEVFRRFRGRDPSSDAYLKNLGLD